jgi:hypothetical protein
MPNGTGRDSASQAGGVIDLGEDRPCALEVGAAGRGEVDTPGGAMKQVHAELGLELADLLGQRRLGHVQPLRGAAEVTLLGDSDEVPEVS